MYICCPLRVQFSLLELTLEMSLIDCYYLTKIKMLEDPTVGNFRSDKSKLPLTIKLPPEEDAFYILATTDVGASWERLK